MNTEPPHLAWYSDGDISAPAVLLLHGFMSCAAQWQPNLKTLGAQRHLIRAELWGHGQSPLPDASAFTVERYVEEFEHIREQAGVQSWHVIGQSYGAGLTLRYAMAHPERVLSVVAINSRSAFGQLVRPDAKRPDPAPDTVLDKRALPYHPIHARRFPADVQQALVTSADAMPDEAIGLGGRLGSRLNCRDVLAEVPMPLLIANGRYERAFQNDLASLRLQYPDLQVADLDGGHSVNIEAAASFDTAVLAFQDNLG